MAEIREALSWVPLKLKTSANGHELSIATGFFYQHNGRSFLITNFHVVSGTNPNTGAILHSGGAIPDSITLGVASKERNTAGAEGVRWRWRQLALYTTINAHEPIWTEHPTYGRRFDVIAIPLAGLEETSISRERAGTRPRSDSCISRYGGVRHWLPTRNERWG